MCRWSGKMSPGQGREGRSPLQMDPRCLERGGRKTASADPLTPAWCEGPPK